MGKEVASNLEQIPRHPGRSGVDKDDILFLCRKELARLLNTEDPRQVILCKNATEALNIAILGIGLKKDDIVVTTASEHNSVLRPLHYLKKKEKIKIKIIPCDNQGRVIEKKWLETITRYSPRLVILNHASNVTGVINPPERLLNFAKKNGCLTLLDASQTLGLLEINSPKIGADMVAFTGHKYLLGPPGTGGLYVKKNIILNPIFSGGTGVRSDLKEMPPEMPTKLEPGTPSFPAFAGLLYSINWQKQNPFPRNKTLALTKRLEKALIKQGAQVIRVENDRTPIVSFRLPGWDINEIGYILDKSFNIICRTGLHCAPLIHRWLGTTPQGTVRFSLSRFTTEKEIDYAIQTIEQLMEVNSK